MKKSVALLSEQDIRHKIYTIRGMQVMLDRDLAEFYQVETRGLKQAVKRNRKRFPEDFMFILNDTEVEDLVSQSVIPTRKVLGGAKPYAFTEQGVAGLSAILTSDVAIEIHIQIMRAFVQVRQFIQNNNFLLQKINAVETSQQELRLETKQKFEQIFQAIEDKNINPQTGVFFEGQVFDAYVFVSRLIKQAKKSIILIDNYIDESVLTLLAKRAKSCVAMIYTKNISKKLQLDLKKHNEQYAPIEAREFKFSHDRFMILDKIEVYHIGASLKDLGKKWFAFSKLDKNSVLEIFKQLKKNTDL